MAVIDTKNCVLKIKGGGEGEEIEVKLGEGNFSYDEKRNMQYIRDRGVLDTVREGDEEPVDVRMDAQWEEITGATEATEPSVEDAMKQRGVAEEWTSTSDDPCEPYCVDLELTNTPDCEGVEPEVVLIQYFRWESINHDMKGGTLAFTGKANVKEANVTRTTPAT